MAHAPAMHAFAIREEEVDGFPAHQRRTVVLDHIIVPRTQELEARAQRQPRPIRRRAVFLAAEVQTPADGILRAPGFGLGVGRRAHRQDLACVAILLRLALGGGTSDKKKRKGKR